MTKPKVKSFSYIAGKKYDGMMGRCYRSTETSYKNYGGRGIRVAGDWISNIDNFKAWLKLEVARLGITEAQFVLNSSKYQLDRIDGDGHYTPANCRLVDVQTNSRNKKSYKGKKLISAEGDTYEF